MTNILLTGRLVTDLLFSVGPSAVVLWLMTQQLASDIDMVEESELRKSLQSRRNLVGVISRRNWSASSLVGHQQASNSIKGAEYMAIAMKVRMQLRLRVALGIVDKHGPN